MYTLRSRQGVGIRQALRCGEQAQEWGRNLLSEDESSW